MTDEYWRPPNSGRRGQVVPLSVVLLVGIVLLSMLAVGVFGGGFAQNTREGVALDAAEKRMVDVSGAIADVRPGGSETATVAVDVGSVSNQGQMQVVETSGAVTVRVGGEVVHSGSLGEIRYESGSAVVAYQAGLVVRTRAGRSAEVVSTPTFGVRDRGTPTLTLPLLVVDGEGSVSDRVTVAARGSREVSDRLRVSSDETVTVTIESEYYRAWERVFAARLGSANVSVEPTSETVTATMFEDEQAYLHGTVYRVEVAGG